MAEFYKLTNEIKHYAWGSKTWIPELLGKENPQGEPYAEMWMGTHPEGSSKTTKQEQGGTVLLSEITELPFLFKFLAAGSPLSIQAHPNLAQARKGFEKENKAGIDLSAANRNYRDPNHKPEIICALSPFTALAGFRKTAETELLLSKVSNTENLRSALKEGYRAFLSGLFGLNTAEIKNLNNSILNAANLMPKNPAKKDLSPISLCRELAQVYPNDPGIIAPLYLNVINLNPFEALFLPAGILHAYFNGFAMECMANSDNVLRGGLTPKHIDIQELFSVLSFDPFNPEILKTVRMPSPGCYRYEAPCDEFLLYLIQNPVSSLDPALPGNQELEAPEMGIFAVYNGTAEISIHKDNHQNNEKSNQKKIVLKKGESVFISRREEGELLHLFGDFTLFAALAR
ncbi:MAG: mannose-6-phosphate isomerase, class I [Treponema sp.]|nr:mannose-6-phosphate isomerase, class I [Treponema sp.]